MEHKTVKIIFSTELIKLRLKSLIGRTGVVVVNGKKSGYWVELDEPFQNEREWFIPIQSLQVIGSVKI